MEKIEKIQKIEITKEITLLIALRYSVYKGESRFISDPQPIITGEKMKIDVFLGEQQIDFFFLDIEQMPESSKIITSKILNGLKRYITDETAIKTWEGLYKQIEELRKR